MYLTYLLTIYFSLFVFYFISYNGNIFSIGNICDLILLFFPTSLFSLILYSLSKIVIKKFLSIENLVYIEAYNLSSITINNSQYFLQRTSIVNSSTYLINTEGESKIIYNAFYDEQCPETNKIYYKTAQFSNKKLVKLFNIKDSNDGYVFKICPEEITSIFK